MIPKKFRATSKGLRVLLFDRCLVNFLFAILTILLLVLAYFKCLGALDWLFEKDFQHFEWPPYLNVRELVDQEMVSPTAMDYPHYNEWSDYTPLVTPTCTPTRQSLLIIVKSAPERAAYRRAIRNTWGAIDRMEGFNVRTVFVMGLEEKGSGGKGSHHAHAHHHHPHRRHQQLLMSDAVRAESVQHGDLLIGNFSDSYYQNIYKWVHSIWLARHYCEEAAAEDSTVPYLFLVDDDYLVSVRNLVREAKRHSPTDRLYMGWRFLSSEPYRNWFNKHRISLKDYPFSRYPPFVTAGAVLLTGPAIKEFYLGIQYVRMLPFDDVYAGIIAHLLQMPASHSDAFSFYEPPLDSKERARFWRGAIASHTFSTLGEIERSYRQFLDFSNVDGIGASASGQSMHTTRRPIV